MRVPTQAALGRDSLDRYLESVRLGLGRAPLPPDLASLTGGGEGAEAAACALAAVRLRLAGPPAPRGLAPVATLAVEPARVPPDATRDLLRRLIPDPPSADAPLGRAALQALAARGYGPHPFDLDRLIPLLAANPDLLDAGTRARAGLTRTEGGESWQGADRPRRLALLRRARLTDPGAARAGLELWLPSVAAEKRAETLPVLAWGLSEADRPFLEALLKDRSGKVKEAATLLLARLGGEPAMSLATRLAALVTSSTTGLLRKRPVLALPDPAKPEDQLGTQGWRFGLRLGAVAAALGLTRAAVLEAELKSPILRQALTIAALNDGDAAAALSLGDGLEGHLWHDLVGGMGDLLGSLGSDVVLQILLPQSGSAHARHALLEAADLLLVTPISPAATAALRPLVAKTRAAQADGVWERIVALWPPAELPALLRDAPAPPGTPAATYAELLAALGPATPVLPAPPERSP